MHQLLECQSTAVALKQSQLRSGGSSNAGSASTNTSTGGGGGTTMDSTSTLISLLPVSAQLDSGKSAVVNTLLQSASSGSGGAVAGSPSLMSLMSPSSSSLLLSKPTNISELSNSSSSDGSSSTTTTLTPRSSSTSLSAAAAAAAAAAGTSGTTHRRTRTARPNSVTEMLKDGKYFERRKRNNVAAKKSRDARKQREDEIAIRASFLEKENAVLKVCVFQSSIKNFVNFVISQSFGMINLCEDANYFRIIFLTFWDQ